MPRIEACVKMSVPPSDAGMLIVAFNFCGAAEMAFDQHRAGVSAERNRRGVVHGAAGDDIFRLANVGDDRLERQADAAGHAGQAERGAHDLEESAARDGVDPFGRAFGEFAVQSLLEFFAAGEFFEAAPVFGAGFFGGVVGRGGVDAFADDVQVQFLAPGKRLRAF